MLFRGHSERETLFARGVPDASSYGGKGTKGSSCPYMPYIYPAEVFLKPLGKYQALLGSFRNPTTSVCVCLHVCVCLCACVCLRVRARACVLAYMCVWREGY